MTTLWLLRDPEAYAAGNPAAWWAVERIGRAGDWVALSCPAAMVLGAVLATRPRGVGRLPWLVAAAVVAVKVVVVLRNPALVVG